MRLEQLRRAVGSGICSPGHELALLVRAAVDDVLDQLGPGPHVVQQRAALRGRAVAGDALALAPSVARAVDVSARLHAAHARREVAGSSPRRRRPRPLAPRRAAAGGRLADARAVTAARTNAASRRASGAARRRQDQPVAREQLLAPRSPRSSTGARGRSCRTRSARSGRAGTGTSITATPSSLRSVRMPVDEAVEFGTCASTLLRVDHVGRHALGGQPSAELASRRTRPASGCRLLPRPPRRRRPDRCPAPGRRLLEVLQQVAVVARDLDDQSSRRPASATRSAPACSRAVLDPRVGDRREIGDSRAETATRASTVSRICTSEHSATEHHRERKHGSGSWSCFSERRRFASGMSPKASTSIRPGRTARATTVNVLIHRPRLMICAAVPVT